MKRLLLIAYYFPPDGGPGTQRAAKLCRELPALGWDVVVLTRPVPGQRGRWDPEDATLLDDVAGCRAVERVAPSPGRGPAHARWAAPAREAAVRLAAEHAVDAVAITMSPYTLAGLVPALQSGGHGPVVCDLRDPWALDGWFTSPTPWHHWRERRCMGRTLAAADLVVANTPAARSAILDAFPAVRADQVTVITNGFDPADYAQPPAPKPRAPGSTLRLVHTGTFHCAELLPAPTGVMRRLKRRLRHHARPIDRRARSPHFLLQAIERLRAEGDELGRRVELVHAGADDDALRRCIESSPAGDAVTLLGYRAHREAVQLMQTADALFLPLHDVPPGERSRIVPGKTYEYLAAGPPILGCLPPGDARTWIEELSAGICVDPTDVNGIVAALRRLDVASAAFTAPTPSTALTRFTRQATASAFAAALDRLTDTPAPEAHLERACAA